MQCLEIEKQLEAEMKKGTGSCAEMKRYVIAHYFGPRKIYSQEDFPWDLPWDLRDIIEFQCPIKFEQEQWRQLWQVQIGREEELTQKQDALASALDEIKTLTADKAAMLEEQNALEIEASIMKKRKASESKGNMELLQNKNKQLLAKIEYLEKEALMVQESQNIFLESDIKAAGSFGLYTTRKSLQLSMNP